MKNEIIRLKDENGNVKEYNVLLVFVFKNNNYIVYTDNGIDVYAKRFNPNDLTVFENINTEEEWNEVERLLSSIEGDENGLD